MTDHTMEAHFEVRLSDALQLQAEKDERIVQAMATAIHSDPLCMLTLDGAQMPARVIYRAIMALQQIMIREAN